MNEIQRLERLLQLRDAKNRVLERRIDHLERELRAEREKRHATVQRTIRHNLQSAWCGND